MKCFFLTISICTVIHAQQHEQNSFPDSLSLPPTHLHQDLSPAPIFQTNTRAEQAKLKQEQSKENQQASNQSRVYHVSTDLNPISQMPAGVQEEFKQFQLKEQERQALPARAMACNKTHAKL